jgi:hypothetical protein
MRARARCETFRKLSLMFAVPVTATAFGSAPASAQWADWVERDRGGRGIPISMFATFVEQGDVIVYPFFEHYRDANAEYEAGELGYVGTAERRGEYRANEGLLFLSYGISDRWAVEIEAAVISARLEKDPEDDSAMPDVLEQSGLGDVEGQIRYRWRPESESNGEIFSYLETVLPLQKKKLLIGTPDWEFKFGTGYMRAHSWGTLVFRGAVAYAEGRPELGEYAVEYVRGLSDVVRIYAGVEGSEDEVEMIAETQLALGSHVVVKLNSAFGATSKAVDWAPEVGVLIRF